MLTGLVRDTSPAIDTLDGCLRQMLLGPARDDGGDAVYAELRRFLYRPLEVIEFEDGEEKVEGQGAISLKFLGKVEENAFLPGCLVDGGHFGTVQEAAGDDVVDLTGFGTEDTGEVERLGTGELSLGGGSIPAVGDEAASGHFLRRVCPEVFFGDRVSV